MTILICGFWHINNPFVFAAMWISSPYLHWDSRLKDFARTLFLNHWCHALRLISSETDFTPFPVQTEFKALSVSPADSCAKTSKFFKHLTNYLYAYDHLLLDFV